MARLIRLPAPVLLLAVVIAAGASPRASQDQATPVSRVSQAEAVVDAMAAGDFDKVTGQFDDTMKKSLPAGALGSGWANVITQIGKFVRRGDAVEQRQGGYITVLVPCEFERGKVNVNVVFNAAGQIAGLQIRPGTAPAAYAPPVYATAAAYTERDVTVGSGEWALPGTLALPAGAGPFPAVVLVHGSGPNDRDESFGPNKVFKDLALGLASRGVAVLRYDKRTLVHQAKLVTVAQFTVKEEAIDDALAAVALLRADAAIDPKRIFVLGHSLGGMIAPRIGAADSGIAGLIVMAGAVRPLDQAILEQLTYLAQADGVVTPEEQKQLDGARQLGEIVAKLTPADAGTAKNISGAPPAYWLDLRGYDPTAAALELSQRILVLQGGRDYQVTAADFDRWKAALDGRPNAELHLYPSLNHLFMPGEGKSLPAEYSIPNHVPVDVITDIERWIKK